MWWSPTPNDTRVVTPPVNRSVELPESAPVGREPIGIRAHRCRVEERPPGASEAVEERNALSLQCLLHQEVVVRREKFDGVLPSDGGDPTGKPVVAGTGAGKGLANAFLGDATDFVVELLQEVGCDTAGF